MKIFAKVKQKNFLYIPVSVHMQNIVFPRIAIKTEINPDALVIRETEKVLDEKITTRTEEIMDDVTGLPHLRTVQVVEKIIETEVVSVALAWCALLIECATLYIVMLTMR